MRLEDFKVGQHITHDNMQGIVQFISEEYITFCISEKPVVCKNSKYKTTKVSVLLFSRHWKDCSLSNTN